MRSIKFSIASVFIIFLIGLFSSCKKEKITSDYFPTGDGSFWVYGNKNPLDSLIITATSNIKSIGGQRYTTFQYNGINSSSTPEPLYYYKSGGIYYENFNIESFIGSPGTPANIEYKFLDANLQAGSSWQSPTFIVTNQGITYTMYIQITLTEKVTTPTTVGKVTSSDILKVKYDYYKMAAGMPLSIFYKEERWFAKGIGLVYNSFDDLSGSGPDIYYIGRKQIN